MQLNSTHYRSRPKGVNKITTTKSLKFITFVFSTLPILFGLSLYSLYFKWNIPFFKNQEVYDIYSFRYRSTSFLGELTFACFLPNIIIIAILINFKYKKKITTKWTLIYFIISFLFLLYILVFDNSHAFYWLID